MRTRVLLTVVGAAALFLTFNALRAKQTSALSGKGRAPVPKVVAYIPNWIDMDAFTRTIEYSKLTHINVAFENPVDDAGNMSFNPKNKILIDRAHAHRVPVLISIGGGGAANDKTLLARYALLLGDAKRAQFAAKLAAFVSQHNFDGLDVDIEGSTINKDYGPFIADLSRALRPKGKLLTAALSQHNGGNIVPDSVFAQFDWINIMSYDAVGPWRPQEPGQHSSMAFTKSTVEYWTKRGLPKHKAVVGVPFYGYGFGEAFVAHGYTYAAIVDAHPGAENKDQVGNTIWYNGIPTTKAKVQYMREHDLGGIMIWSLNSDAKGKRSLLSAIHEELKQPKPKKPATR